VGDVSCQSELKSFVDSRVNTNRDKNKHHDDGKEVSLEKASSNIHDGHRKDNLLTG
jgi:hypothetical protein